MLFQVLMFKMARVEVFLSPDCDDAVEMKRRLRLFHALTVGVIVTYVVCLASPLVRTGIEA